MVQSEAVKGVYAKDGAGEGWFWKGVTGVLAAALAAIAVQSHGVATAPTPAITPADLERLEARIAQLETLARTPAPAAPAPAVAPETVAQLTSRLDRAEARLAAVDEIDDWQEATRLGVTKALAERAKGLTPRQEARLAATIVREARLAGLDPLLVAGVIQVESGFNAFAVSRVGAVGMMQLMPRTAGWLADASELPSASHLFDFERNIHLGCQYLAALIRQFGGVDRALVAYNMGPAAARKALAGPRAKQLLAGYPHAVDKARSRLVDSQEPQKLGEKLVTKVAQVERRAAR